MSANNNTLLYYDISPNVKAFSTTRISPFDLNEGDIKAMGEYAAFNVTHYCGDEPQRVERNKQWLCNELGINEAQLWLPRQTHTDNVLCINDDFLKLPKDEQTTKLQNIDALITNIPNQCIGVSTADCVPLLIYDQSHQAVAAIHAGWRGTIKRIAQKSFVKMKETYQTKASDCMVVIGPSISVDAFEVGEEVVEAFTNEHFSADIVCRSVHNPNAKPHIDLWAANVCTLEECGFDLSQIRIAGICTYQHCDTFFSARRLGINSGRIFTGICLK